MLKFTDGFDHFSGQSGEVLEKSLNSAGYAVTGSMAIIEGRKELTRCLSIEGSLSRTFNTTSTTVVFGFAYLAKARSPIVEIDGVLTLNWDAEISIGENKGVAIPVLDVWYYYEIVINKVDKTITIRINDDDDLTVAMPDDVTFMQDYKIKWSSTAESGPKMLDDIYFLDGSAGEYTQPIGPIQLGLRLPDADVVSQFSPSKGVDHFQMVNNIPPIEGEFIQSNESGYVDTFTSNSDVPNGDIIAVGVVMRVKKSDIDGRQAAAIIGDLDGDYKELVHSRLNTDYEYKYAMFEKDPKNQKWVYQSVMETPYGIRVKP